VSPRLALVGAAAGLLSGLLGIGGGIVLVPGLIWAAGLDRHTASGTSLVAILPIAAVAAVTYAVAPGGAFDAEASAVFLLGSVTGAVLGALLISLCENLFTLVIPSTYKPMIAFVLLLLVLFVRPQGLIAPKGQR